MKGDGSDVRSITDSLLDDLEPAWSPDASKIAFTSTRVGNLGEVFVMNADGSDQERVTFTEGLLARTSGATWYPDGSSLGYYSLGGIFSAPDELLGRIHRKDFHDGRFRASSPMFVDSSLSGTSFTNPEWSPDGTKMAFSDGIGALLVASHSIMVGGVFGGGATELTGSLGTEDHAAWSPDGSKIAFSSLLGLDNWEIFVINSDGTGKVRLTNNLGNDTYPTWSPDGLQIAFQSNSSGRFEIYVMNADGSDQRALTQDGGMHPDWGPLFRDDGTAVLPTPTPRPTPTPTPVVLASSSFTVNSTIDAPDANPGDLDCDDGAGSCTLRAAIMESNSRLSPDVITLPSGVFMISLPEIMDISDDLIINGSGANSTIIDWNEAHGLVISEGKARILGVTMRNAVVDKSRFGGGITVFGSAELYLSDSIVEDNTGEKGGGIKTLGKLTINNSTIRGNTAFHGGGIDNDEATLIVTGSTISGNSAERWGGGIMNSGKATIANSTISGNDAGVEGGGIESRSGRLVLSNNTITGNTSADENATFPSGGITFGLDSELKNNIIADNWLMSDRTQIRNCAFRVRAKMYSIGHNLINDDSCRENINHPTDLYLDDPLLGPLQDNASCPATDQRGEVRPQGAGCEIGAYELVR